MLLLILLACAPEPDGPEAVTLRAEFAPWTSPWESLELASEDVEVDGDGVLIASGTVPAQTWVHVFPDIADAVSGDQALADVVEPIAARFVLPPGGARLVTVELLVLDDTPEGPALFAVDTLVR